MPNRYGSSEHWFDCAQDARVMAEHITDPEAQRAMREIAANYEKIAKCAETREIGLKFPPRETD
jgi:hypothetical protein